jgi:hypothetical protein
VERVVLDALAYHAAALPDICAFGDSSDHRLQRSRSTLVTFVLQLLAEIARQEPVENLAF